MPLLWNETEHSVGHPLLDEQHRTLLSICHQLAGLSADETPHAEGGFLDVLGELARYADTHFETEESLLKKHGYPELTDQIGEHDEYRARMTLFLRNARHGVLERSRIQAYLVDWWLGHIANTDMKFRGFLEARLAADPSGAA